MLYPPHHQHGACVNAMDLWQFTPLHEAASKNRVEVCSLLLSYGADPTLLNCHNKSAIDLAPTPQLKERLACKYKMMNVQLNSYTSNLKVFASWVFFVGEEFLNHRLFSLAMGIYHCSY